MSSSVSEVSGSKPLSEGRYGAILGTILTPWNCIYLPVDDSTKLFDESRTIGERAEDARCKAADVDRIRYILDNYYS